MGFVDWLIVIIPVTLVMGLGIYSRNYVHGVADFLSAGRCAGRYVLSMGDMASALAITGLISYIEVHYKTGFAIAFWGKFLAPMYIAMSLYVRKTSEGSVFSTIHFVRGDSVLTWMGSRLMLT